MWAGLNASGIAFLNGDMETDAISTSVLIFFQNSLGSLFKVIIKK